MRKIRTWVVVPAVAVLLASCGGSGSGSPRPEETPVETATTVETPVTTASAPFLEPSAEEGPGTPTAESLPPSSPAVEPSSSDTAQPAPASASSDENAPILGEENKGEPLTLSDFFRPSERYWEENRYDVADQRDVSGISSEIDECGTRGYSDPEDLELRLANNFTRLMFTAGQANGSISSKQTLVVRVEGNGGQLDIKRIPFNEIATFDISVPDVNSVIIQVYLDDEVEDCIYNGSAQVVLWGFELQ